MRYIWAIELLLPGRMETEEGGWLEICRCENGENAAKIVQALCLIDGRGPAILKIRTVAESLPK